MAICGLRGLCVALGQENAEAEVETYLKRSYGGRIKTTEVVKREDLDLVGSIPSSQGLSDRLAVFRKIDRVGGTRWARGLMVGFGADCD
jgi:hypothetical protein